jgi:outer membrane protein OmpA-like peptidoglycan-associated protein
MRIKATFQLFFLLLFNLSTLVVYSQNVIVHFPFDNTVKDISGNNNNGLIIGDVKPAVDRFGNYCGALSFNGTNGYIEVPDSKSLSSVYNKMSVACWFKLDKNTAHPANKWLTLICKGEDITETNNNPQYRVQVFQSDKQSTVSVNTEFTEFDNNFNNHLIEYGKWYFYTLVYDGSSVNTYLNGNKIWGFPYNGVFNNNKMPLNIGRDIPGSLEFFCGSLDDLRIYNGILTEDVIMKLYNDKSGSVFEEPFTLKCPENSSVNINTDICFAIVKYKEPEFMVNCGEATVKLIKGLQSGSNFPVGSTNITYKVESNIGRKKTCSFTITVKDNTPPVIKCPADIKLTVDTGTDFIKYDYNSPSVSDACGIDTILLMGGLMSSADFPVGNTENKFKVIDRNGNSAVCSFNVIVSSKPPKNKNVSSVAVDNTNQTQNSPMATNPPVIINPSVSNAVPTEQEGETKDKAKQDELDWIALSKQSLEKDIAKLQEQQSKIADDKDKLASQKKNMGDTLMLMQVERDKLAAEKLQIEQDKMKLELLKKQQEKEVLDLKRSIDSLAKAKQQVSNGTQDPQNYDLFSVPLEVGAVAQIKNIYFVADASFLQIPSYVELDKVVQFLQTNKSLKVEIGGHTNGICDDTFCMKLSANRAKTCVDYLISKGIDSARLNYKGYGKTKLLKPESPGNPLNQRVEIKIIGI